MTKEWTIFRHAGRGRPGFNAYSAPEDLARQYFERRREVLDQGSIALYDHAGGLQMYYWAPGKRRR